MNKRYNEELSIKELAALDDAQIDYSDIPDLDNSLWDNAVVKMPVGKTRLTVRFDADVVNWFKGQGKGYQTRMNAVLRSFYKAQQQKEKHEKH